MFKWERNSSINYLYRQMLKWERNSCLKYDSIRIYHCLIDENPKNDRVTREKNVNSPFQSQNNEL